MIIFVGERICKQSLCKGAFCEQKNFYPLALSFYGRAILFVVQPLCKTPISKLTLY